MSEVVDRLRASPWKSDLTLAAADYMESLEQEIARLTAELERANRLIDRMSKELASYDDDDFSYAEEN